MVVQNAHPKIARLFYTGMCIGNLKMLLKSSNIIVVYGESRQGKTWTIEKYCPHQIRIGCDATMSIESIKNEMLDRVDMPVMSVEHVLTESHKYEDAVSTSVGTKMLIKAGSDFSDSSSFTESLKTSYLTVDTKKKSEFFSDNTREICRETFRV